MDLKGYMEQVYRWLQRFYNPETLEGPVEGIYHWLLDLSWARILNMIVWTVVIAVIVDLVLYWTRRDQKNLVRRAAAGFVSLWNKLLGSTSGKRTH